MKSSRFPILVTGLIFGLGLQAACAESSRHEGYTGFALPPEVVLPEAETHPALWFKAEDVPGLIAKRTGDAHLAGLWQEVSASPFLLAALPELPDVSDDKKTIHQYYGHLTQIAFYNAFLYQVGDPDEKPAHLAAAKAALLRGYEGPLYQLDPIIKGSAVDEIYQGSWAQNFAAAYDMIQPALSAAEDGEIRETLVRHARYLYDNLYSWADSPHNHLSKPAWGLGTLALCLSDHADAQDWLFRAVDASNLNTRYFFGEDGIYREGTHYYTFSLINFVPFLYHYRNVSGFDAFEAFQPAFEWPLLIRNGKGWIPNQEDSYLRPYPSQLVAGAYLDAPTRLHSSAPLGSILQWNFENTDFGPFDAAEASTGYNYTGATWDYPKPLIEFLCYQSGIEAVAPDAGPTVFLPSGQTVFRSDWSFASPDHRYLLFQGVAEADNHQHFEHLSFILQAENQMMSSDSGYSRGSYAGPERTAWYRTPEAHNVVMVNGQAPADQGPDITPESRHRLVSPFFDCEMKVAPYANGGEHRRLVCLVDGRRFAIVDQVDLEEDSEIAVVMHGGRAGLDQKGPQSVWSYQDDTYGPAAVMGQWFFGQGYDFQEKSGELTYIKGDYGSFPYWVRAKQGQKALALSLLDPAARESDLSAYEAVEVGADRLRVAGSLDRYLVNSSRQSLTDGELETDALLTCVVRPEDPGLRLGLIDVKSFSFGDLTQVDLDRRSTLALDVGDASSVTVYLADESPVEARITVGDSQWSVTLMPGMTVLDE